MERLVEGIGIRRRPANETSCRGRLADVINCSGARPTRWVEGSIRPTRWVIGGIRRTPGNRHQDPEVVMEKVEGWSTPGGCGEIHDGIER